MNVLYIKTVTAATIILYLKPRWHWKKSCLLKKNMKNEMTNTFILRYWYHRYPPCPKFTECIRQKQADSADKSTQNSNSVDKKFKSASTRANKKRVNKWFVPMKRAKRKHFPSSVVENVMKKILRSVLPVLPTSSVSL